VLFRSQIFDYIYAVLHSPSYREKYKEFLKIDFPRIPYPENAEQFERLAGFGERLRKLHLMENVEAILAAAQNVANFPVAGTNEIENSFTEKSGDYRDNKVFINDAQYFDNVPQTAWEFYIGGYQPAQKWLKDRKGRKLEYDDVRHYQKMIAVLCETEQIMTEIDSAVPFPNVSVTK
jgi:predicted helicase